MIDEERIFRYSGFFKIRGVRFLAAALIVLVGLGVRALLTPMIGLGAPLFQIFSLCVLLAGVVGGFWPGIFATLLFALSAKIWFVGSTSGTFQLALSDELRLLVFFFEGLAISAICSVLRSSWFLRERRYLEMRRSFERESRLKAEIEDRAHALTAAEEDLRAALDSLRDSEERLSLAVSSADLGTWDLDAKTRKMTISKTFAKLLGTPGEEGVIAVEDFLKRIEPTDAAAASEQFEKVLSRKGPAKFRLEFRVPIDAKSPRWLSVRGRAYFDSEGKPQRMVGIALDITEQRAAEEDMLKTKIQAEYANQAKTRFLANISHEIRTPLGAMLGFAELALDPSQKERDRQDFLRTIIRNGESLRHVIDDILDVVSFESERLNVEKRCFDFRALINEVAALVSPKAREKGLQFEIHIDERVPKQIESDPARLRQILLNILGNAVKFTQAGSVITRIRAYYPSTSAQPIFLEFEIADTGPGFSEEQKSRIFQLFSQGDSSYVRRFGGSGLGLFLSKRLAQELGGYLSLTRSEPGHGSVFTLRINAGRAELKSLPNHTASMNSPQSQSQIPGMKILVVDDAPDNCVLISRYLKKAGAETKCAANGREGVHAALEGNFDVVLMDLQMPVLDGYEAIRTLRQSGYRKPIVAITAHALRGERERCLRTGAEEVLVKPVDRNVLIKTMSQYQEAKVD